MTGTGSLTLERLRDRGFEGFVLFSELQSSDVPRGPGVYIVLRTSGTAPTFLEASRAGWFKGKDPSVPVARLQDNWVDDTPVVYIGKASARVKGAALSKRLDEYRRHGIGEPIGHWGGRFIWQLADHADLLVCWKASVTVEAEDEEAQLISEFVDQHRCLPFANLKRGRRTP